jgi:hypothetical protein
MTAIYLHKTDAMRQLLNRVSRGYSRYVTGTLAPKKVEALVLKFTDRYAIDRTHQQRYRAKQKAEANSHLVMWLEAENQVRWWLLVTPGDGLVEELEQLQDTGHKKQRLTLTGYELLKTPRKDKPAAWSWRMTHDNHRAWQERLKTAVRHNNEEAIRQAMYSLSRVPAFSESRKQAFDLFRLAKGDWQRTQRKDWPYGEIYIGFYGKFQTANTLDARQFSQQARRKTNKHRTTRPS